MRDIHIAMDWAQSTFAMAWDDGKGPEVFESRDGIAAVVQVDSGNRQSNQILQVSQSGVVTEAKPNYLKNPAPVYPIRARNQGQQGLVELEVEINSDGSVKSLRLK